MALMNVERVGVVVAGRIARTMGGTRRRLAALIQKSIQNYNDNDILYIKSQESVG